MNNVKPDLKDCKSLLILPLDNLGDTVLFSGTLRHIRHNFKNATISLFVKNYVRNFRNYLKLRSKLGNAARNLTDFFVSITQSNSVTSQSNQKKQLLIIKPDAIGDFVIFTGILPAIREKYSSEEWEITLLGSKEYESLAKFICLGVIDSNSDPLFDLFIPINPVEFSRNLIYRFKFQKKIQMFSYDVVLHPVFSRSYIGDRLVVISHAKEKIGINGDSMNIDLRIKQRNNVVHYTKIIPSEPDWRLEIERNLSFVRGLGIDKPIDGIPKWKIPDEIIFKLREVVTSQSIDFSFVIVCPGASASFRRWPTEKMATVIDYLWERYKIPTLLCGSQADQIISEQIQKKVKTEQVACLCGHTSLVELAGLISMAKLCVSMDSSPAHLAVAVNTPVVCITGGGHYKRFFPYGDPNLFRAATEELDCFYCDWKCKFGKPFCVQDIAVSTVTKEIDQLMNIINP